MKAVHVSEVYNHGGGYGRGNYTTDNLGHPDSGREFMQRSIDKGMIRAAGLHVVTIATIPCVYVYDIVEVEGHRLEVTS